MSRSPTRIFGLLVSAVATLAALAPASAQTVCITPNCAFGATPAPCANRAAPRTPTVRMGSGLSLIFVPSNPKIEPGDCIIWRTTSNTHSSSGSQCVDDSLCGSPAPSTCQWDSANVAGVGATSTCFYDPVQFPASTADAYYCRIHATPTTGTMRGTLEVTTAISLLVDKDTGTNSVKLSWAGGGVTGDISYKIARQSGGDPLFPSGTTTTVNPDGGVLGTTFTDTGDLTDPTTRYYLVRNKQTNE